MCKKYQLDNINPSVFLRTSEELEDLIPVIKKIEEEIKGKLSNRVYHLNKENLEDLIKFCRSKNIPLTSDIFHSNINKIKETMEVCKNNDIEFKEYFLIKNAKDLEDLIEFTEKK